MPATAVPGTLPLREDLKEQVDVVRQEAVVVELGRIASLGPRQEVEEVAEGRLLGQEELAVVATSNEVVAAPTEQLAWWSGHGD